MKRRNFIATSSVALTAGFGIHNAVAKPSMDRPNILFIMADDHATQAISCYGSWLAKNCTHTEY